jgi:hypothetical protein
MLFTCALMLLAAILLAAACHKMLLHCLLLLLLLCWRRLCGADALCGFAAITVPPSFGTCCCNCSMFMLLSCHWPAM